MLLTKSHKATDNLCSQTPPASQPVRAHTSFSVLVSPPGCTVWLAVDYSSLWFQRMKSLLMWNVGILDLWNPLFWSQRKIFLILNKSDKVMSGFKERSITLWSHEPYPAEVPAEGKGIVQEVMEEGNHGYQQGFMASYRDGDYSSYACFTKSFIFSLLPSATLQDWW